MNILLNGEPFELARPMSLQDLVATLELSGKRIAIEYNLEIIPKSEHPDVMLQENDRVEIVHAIGGG